MTEEPMGSNTSDGSHESDCEKVQGVFEKWLEGVATTEDEAFLAERVDECSPCFESIDKQQLFVKFLNSSLRRPGIPANLADTIKSKIHQTA
jgi:predicted anti-sigma-YlaC factor YlaD